MKAEDPKMYVVKTFDQLCNMVNPENIDRLATDLASWLIFYNRIITNFRTQYPDQAKGKKNTQIAKSTFQWVDDDISGISGVDLVNKDTGEVAQFRSKS